MTFLKKMLTLAIILACFSVCYGSGGPRVVLNFDVNGTIVADDSMIKGSFMAQVNKILAKKYKAHWGGVGSPEVTFYQYVLKKITQEKGHPDTFPHLSELIESEIALFTYLLDKFPHVEGSLKEKIRSEYSQLLGDLTRQPTEVVPSFFALIRCLKQNKVPFNILLRTFGPDLDRLVPVIEKESGLKFVRGKFHERTLTVQPYDGVSSQTLDSAAAIEALFRENHKNFAIQDDYNYWSKNGRNWRFGKGFYLGNVSSDTKSFFFDDNIDFHSHTSIVTPLNISISERQGLPVELNQLNGHHAVQVDTYSAITDHAYFIKIVESYVAGLKCGAR